MTCAEFFASNTYFDTSNIKYSAMWDLNLKVGANNISLNDSIYFEPGSVLVWRGNNGGAKILYQSDPSIPDLRYSSDFSRLEKVNFRVIISAYGLSMIASRSVFISASFPVAGFYQVLGYINNQSEFNTTCMVNVLDSNIYNVYFHILINFKKLIIIFSIR